MTPDTPLVPAAHRRFGRSRLILAAVGVVAIAALAGTIYVSLHAGNSYESFRHDCLANAGNSVVIVSQTSHAAYMGGLQKTYTMGCKQPNGSVISTAKTSKP
jgi:photosystem II stability/assembly factor-like uncharacterized protein